jgi:Group II intron, maturase-specific domain./Reverse transcriptase (RNA-dependent DNA polymerase).
MDKTILGKWLKCGYMKGNKLYPTNNGTPQGGVISPVLANLTLDGMEREIHKFGKVTHCQSGYIHRNRHKLNFVRYSDDFIITASSREILESGVKPLITRFLSERGLVLSSEKTSITHIENGFDFLGQNIRKYKGKLIIKPSKGNVKVFLKKVRDTINKYRTATTDNLIRVLNPLIRGWANYHQHVSAKQTFSFIDHHIWQTLWRWAKRRHHNKSSAWIKSKYFTRKGSRGWVFGTKLTQLLSASKTKIIRHVKVKYNFNPYETCNPKS